MPIGLIAALVAPLVVPEGRDTLPRKGFDVLGAILLTAGLVLLIYTLGQSASVGWLTVRTIGSLVLVMALLLVFVLVERQTIKPLVPLSIFRLQTMRIANITAILTLGALVTLFFFASLYMQQVLDYSPMRTGLAYVPIAIIISIGAGVSQQLVRKTAAKPVLITGLILAICGLLMLWRIPVHANYLNNILPAFLIGGFGLGMAFVPVQVAAFAGVSKYNAGLAAGLINTSQEAGGALGVAVAASIVFARVPALTAWANGDPVRILEARASVFHEAFLIGAGFALLGLLVAMAMPRMRASEAISLPPV